MQLSPLSPLVKHTISVELQCDSCKFATVDTKKQVVMSISIPKYSKSLNMTNLITSSHVCDKCNAPLKVRTQIVDANQIIELKLDVWRKVEGGAKTVRRTASINSSDKIFTLQSSV